MKIPLRQDLKLISKQMFRIAIPIAISGIITQVQMLIDTAFLARYTVTAPSGAILSGSDILSAVGNVFFPYLVTLSFLWSITTGAIILVSQRLGAREPESARRYAVASLKYNSLLAWLVYLFWLLFAEKIFVLMGVREPILERGAKRVEVITNGADLHLFSPGAPDPQLRESWGGKDQFVVLYAGTLGLAHGLRTAIEAAALLRDRRVRFVFIGEGAQRAELEADAAGRGLTNVQFVGLQPRKNMADAYRSADICLVSLRALALFDAFIPSKIFEILACGRPMIAAISGEALALVTDAGAAIPAEPGSATSLAHAVEDAMESVALPAMGKSGRHFVELRFDRTELAERYLRLLEETTRQSHALM